MAGRASTQAPHGKPRKHVRRRGNAMSENDKAQRRDDMLQAARRLFRRVGALPTVSDIAATTGLAKGTIYLYFRTKEELFVALLEEDFARLLGAINGIIANLPGDGMAASETFAREFGDALRALPDLLALAALAHGVLEKNLPLEAMRRFKGGLAADLGEAGNTLNRRFPELTPAAASSLLLHSWALTLGLSQSLRIPEALVHAMQGPEFAALRRDPDEDLRTALVTLWRGRLSVMAPST